MAKRIRVRRFQLDRNAAIAGNLALAFLGIALTTWAIVGGRACLSAFFAFCFTGWLANAIYFVGRE